MPILIETPARVASAGAPPKVIEEFIGAVKTGQTDLSVALMRSPPGWTEPGQTPDFDEYTIVLKGLLQVESAGATLEVRAGQAVVVRRGEHVRYSTPGPEGAEYVAICVPAFTIAGARRDSA